MKWTIGNWNDLQAMAAPLRTEVFVREQNVPQEMEWDDEDHRAVHGVLQSPSGEVVATGRLISHGHGLARIGRMAVCCNSKCQSRSEESPQCSPGNYFFAGGGVGRHFNFDWFFLEINMGIKYTYVTNPPDVYNEHLFYSFGPGAIPDINGHFGIQIR